MWCKFSQIIVVNIVLLRKRSSLGLTFACNIRWSSIHSCSLTSSESGLSLTPTHAVKNLLQGVSFQGITTLFISLFLDYRH